MDERRELEEQAAKGKAIAAQASAERQEAQLSRAREKARGAGTLHRRSLGLPRVLAQATSITAIFASVGAFMLVVFATTDGGSAWLLAAALVLVLASAGAVYWFGWVYPDRQMGWLESLPFEFDTEAYLAVLQERHWGRRLMVTVKFKVDVEGELAQSLALAVTGAMRGAVGRMVDSRTLMITGKVVRTWFLPGKTTSMASTKPIHDNSNVHAQFRQCVRRCLGPISKHAPIQRVIVRAPQATP